MTLTSLSNVPLVSPFAGPLDKVVVFAVSLLIGGAAIHASARYAVYRDSPGKMTFEHAVVTALLGALVWALLEWVPLVGSLLALVGWVTVIRWRYPGGWGKAGVTGAAAWAAAIVALAALELVGVGSVSALGVPGA
jgi:hypothetical protein